MEKFWYNLSYIYHRYGFYLNGEKKCFGVEAVMNIYEKAFLNNVNIEEKFISFMKVMSEGSELNTFTRHV